MDTRWQLCARTMLQVQRIKHACYLMVLQVQRTTDNITDLARHVAQHYLLIPCIQHALPCLGPLHLHEYRIVGSDFLIEKVKMKLISHDDDGAGPAHDR